MSTTTTKHGLIKPELTDPADITQMNNNWDIIDEKLNAIPVTSDVPSDAEMWIDPDEVSAEEAHLTDMDNPHNVTISQIGAAPSGYGLGTGAIFLGGSTDLNDIKENGWYHFNAPTNKPFSYAHMLVVAGNDKDTNAHQVCFSRNSDNAIAIRQLYGGAWQPWEYIDPPMVLGTEYRTTDKWNGKAVYTKLVSIGAVSTDGTATVAHGASVTQMLRCNGQLSSGDTIPLWAGGATVTIFASKTSITVITSGIGAGNTAYGQIWYTKD